MKNILILAKKITCVLDVYFADEDRDKNIKTYFRI
jgi:hypothetical protein